MTNSIGEIADSELLFIIGSNTTEAHPIIGNMMKKAVKNGTKLIVIDPRRTELAAMADHHISIKSGTDAALVNGIMRVILKEGLEATEFIEERCIGLDAVKEMVEKYTPKYVEEITGVDEESLVAIAKLYATTDKAGIFYTLGITEHTTGTSNVMNLANLAMITGHIGRPSVGVNPLRGQNNVQGACDMGGLPNYYPGYRFVDDKDAQDKYEAAWGVPLSPHRGLKIPEMIDEAAAGNLKAMYIMGEDPVLTDADANHVKSAFSNLDFLVVQNLFMTETSKIADVILPSSCYAEKDGTFTNTERRVQRVRKAVNHPEGCHHDWEYIQAIGQGLDCKGFEFEKEEDIFEEIRSLTPQYAGISYKRIEEDGIQWPCMSEDHPGTQYLHKGTFTHGKGVMIPVEYEPPAEITNSEYPILLNTGRMLYHYNVSTRLSSTLDDIRPHELAEINPQEAELYGLTNDSVISVISRRGSIKTKIVITDRVQPGTMFMTFHYKESPVNQLTNSAFDPITKTAEFKVTAVKIVKESGTSVE